MLRAVRARATYDWAVVFRQYQALWSQLTIVRVKTSVDGTQKATLQAAPKVAPSRLDPFRSFGHYPTRLMSAQTSVESAGAFSRADYEQLAQHGLFVYAARTLPSADLVENLFRALADGPLTAAELARRALLDIGVVLMATACLAKMGLVKLNG